LSKKLEILEIRLTSFKKLWKLVGEEVPDKYEKKHYLNLKESEKQAS